MKVLLTALLLSSLVTGVYAGNCPEKTCNKLKSNPTKLAKYQKRNNNCKCEKEASPMNADANANANAK